MSKVNIETRNLRLVLQTPEDVRAQIHGMSADEKAELSGGWLALVDSATSADPWVHGFQIVQRADNIVVGSIGFKGPPTDDDVVEIAYGIHPEHRSKGYATEAAVALVSYAFNTGAVRSVRAHTLTTASASTRVLTKCGFRRIGEVIDPDDGLVWRWEKHDEAT
jgi:ribosomal-protein-alanine N-acetyltransferase